MTVDREVDIFTIARQLQVRRPEFVSTLVSISKHKGYILYSLALIEGNMRFVLLLRGCGKMDFAFDPKQSIFCYLFLKLYLLYFRKNTSFVMTPLVNI